jgi:hypothetical protein
MKPTDYDDYSAVYDFFSAAERNPLLCRFVDALAERLPDGARIADVGGGTGLVADALLAIRPDLRIDFIEPAAPMRERARARLGERAHFHETDLEAALPCLDEMDAFVFARSFYALYGRPELYTPLLKGLASRLTRRGYLALWEVEGPYDLSAAERDWRAALGSTHAALFDSGWPAYRAALARYNAGLLTGEFCLLRPDDVAALAATTGFDLEQSSPPLYFLRKGVAPMPPKAPAR